MINTSWCMYLPLSTKGHQTCDSRFSRFFSDSADIFLLVDASKHFRHLLEGHPFGILTDHRALVSAIGSPSKNYSPREIRHLAFVAESTTDIQHVAGTDNVVADALSAAASMTLHSHPPWISPLSPPIRRPVWNYSYSAPVLLQLCSSNSSRFLVLRFPYDVMCPQAPPVLM